LNHYIWETKRIIKKGVDSSINFFLFGDHFPEKINDISQSVGIDDEGDGLAEKDNQHVLFESHLGQGSQHAEKVGWTDRPNHHENKEALIEGAATVLQLDRLDDKEQATKVATEQVNLGVKNSVQQGILVEDGKSVKLDLVLEKGELKLNGNVIPEEQVFSILFLAMMSMGQ